MCTCACCIVCVWCVCSYVYMCACVSVHVVCVLHVCCVCVYSLNLFFIAYYLCRSIHLSLLCTSLYARPSGTQRWKGHGNQLQGGKIQKENHSYFLKSKISLEVWRELKSGTYNYSESSEDMSNFYQEVQRRLKLISCRSLAREWQSLRRWKMKANRDFSLQF